MIAACIQNKHRGRGVQAVMPADLNPYTIARRQLEQRERAGDNWSELRALVARTTGRPAGQEGPTP